MPSLRAAIKGMLRRSMSSATGSSASSGNNKAEQQDASNSRSNSISQSSSLLLNLLPLKSPSKFSVHDSIREDDEFHDAAETTTLLGRPSTTSNTTTAITTPAPTSAHHHSVQDNNELEYDYDTASSRSRPPQARLSGPPSIPSPSLLAPPPLSPKRPSSQTVRRQSLLSGTNAPAARVLVLSSDQPSSTPIEASEHFVDAPVPPAPNLFTMSTRKVWVKRPNASPTMVTVRQDDLVDDVRDLVMRKYGNSLGRNYDSPDLVLRIISRSDDNGKRGAERMLCPDEDICRTLDSYYSGGQTAEEALLIETPTRRTPRPSPRIFHGPSYAALDDYRPAETGSDYFPPMPAVQLPPNVPGQPPAQATLHPEVPRSIAVLNTGQIPVLPSPGAARRHRDPRDPRPKFNRQHTSSPTIMTHNPPPASMPLNASNLAVSQHLPTIRQGRPRVASNASEQQSHNTIPSAPPLPTPPPSDPVPAIHSGSTPPTPASQGQGALKPTRPRRQRKLTPTDGTATVKSSNGAKTSLPPSLLDGAVPPINVLIVEDNLINLRLLEAFMKRLKVRWSTALNGQIAVNKWRTGGYHLVLMDIQMPIMSGLEATKEIRRLESVNGIGVFSTALPPSHHTTKGENGEELDESKNEKDDDRLPSDGGLFKSPVIIVALTASSLQSDRHEALTAGCNDFLTKPVNFVWLERKVKEWGCMQALIDFDGWRKWKDFDADKAFKEKKVKRLSRASAEGTAVAPRSPRPTATAEVVAAPPATATAASNNGEGALMTTTTEKAT